MGKTTLAFYPRIEVCLFDYNIQEISVLLVEPNELAVIDAVYTRKNGVRLGFVDFYVASYYSKLISKKNLHIVRTIPRGRAYGVLMGEDWDPKAVECFRRVSEDNRRVVHEVIPKYIKRSEVNVFNYIKGLFNMTRVSLA